MASYITRNANILLLFLILLAATALVGATVYFQERFGSINTEYDAKLAQLDNVSATLEEYQEILSAAREELALKGSREDELTSKFTSVKTEKEEIETQRDTLKSDKKTLEAQLAIKTNEVNTLNNELGLKDATIISLKDDIDDLEDDIVKLDDDVDDLQDEVDCLESTPDAGEGSC